MHSVPSSILASILASHTATASSIDIESALSFLKTSSQSTTPSPHVVLDDDPLSTLLTRRKIAPIVEKAAEPTGLEWLHSSLSEHAVGRVVEILRSPSSDDDIAESLLEIWGFEGIESVSLAMQRRREIIQEVESFGAVGGGASREAILETNRNYVPSAQISFKTSEEIEFQKRNRKSHKNGKGKQKEEDSEEIDLEEWQRIRNEQLSIGPGPLWTGKKVS